MEMLAALSSNHNKSVRAELQSVREENEIGDASYHANIQPVLNWFHNARVELDSEVRPFIMVSTLRRYPADSFFELLPLMLDESPGKRPQALQLRDSSRFGDISRWLICEDCSDGPEPFEAAKPLSA